MSGRSRIERFVSSARMLLAAQVAAAAGAGALTVWAAVEVQAVIDDNERLAARLAELERSRPPAVTAEPLEAPPDFSPVPEVRTDPKEVAGGGPDVVDNSLEETPAPGCADLQGQAVDCVPPFRATPVAGTCIDGMNRRIRCPEGVDLEDEPPPSDGRRPLDAAGVTDRQIEARPPQGRPPPVR